MEREWEADRERGGVEERKRGTAGTADQNRRICMWHSYDRGWDGTQARWVPEGRDNVGRVDRTRKWETTARNWWPKDL